MGSEPADLKRILTREKPLGPPYTEELLRSPHGIFEQLYDRTNGVHGTAEREDPTYVVGRKGSGKTAFLVGTAFVNGAKVILIKSEDIYHEIERLRTRYVREVGPLFAENLSQVWKVLLMHAAMLLSCRVARLRQTDEGRLVAAYLSAYGNPSSLDPEVLLARVGSALSDALVTSPPGLTVAEMCGSLRTDVATYEDARNAFSRLSVRTSARLYVVVDNLEDLHVHVDNLRTTLSALFRTARDFTSPTAPMPFKVRFAFPAELLRRLRDLTSNPEKDFLDYLVIRWSAPELMTVVGNRLRRFLDLYHEGELRRLGLPRQHDERDQHMAEMTLRALLPSDPIRTGLALEEDPVAYVMRHTQLLPRHLIQLLNEILSRPARRSDSLPVATPRDVLEGVRDAELRIVDGVLSSYSHDYPYMATALGYLKNHIPNTLTCSELHKAFNAAGVARAGVDYNDFLEGALDVGVLGIVERGTSRYTIGRFAYTFAETLRPVEDSDAVCIHPLFMFRLFDRGGIRRLREQSRLPVYPYGSDLGQIDYD
ncbi:P-loop ATPase, Sll1717 family [Blastococcus litoris]|uniref:P-loop ATPase, Sll1717 family n=1 Tax=Blastococcus litoris TaxID=2171622 RepID=UPI000E303232|nr:hypothetical protein [Blastococcus litoris]